MLLFCRAENPANDCGNYVFIVIFSLFKGLRKIRKYLFYISLRNVFVNDYMIKLWVFMVF